MDQTGWWTFDPETQSLVNRVSGQRIRHEGAADETGGRARLRFSYQDADVRYPVLVTARSEPYGGAGYDLRDPTRRSRAWSIDHSASAAAWRRLANADAAHPPYGLWRRVDDALFDALACWPPTDRTGPEPSRIDSWGGWSNGAWVPPLRRVGAGRAEKTTPVERGVAPYLEPLASPAPSWRFHDARMAVAGMSPAGIRTLRSGMHVLPRNAALTGFESGIPHLRRHGGKAVMFPHRVLSGLDKDGYYTARAQFAYADEDVFFLFEGSTWSWSDGAPGNWTFELDELTEFGVRDPKATGLPDGLVCSRKVYDWRGPQLQPLPRLAQRLTAALIDGWLAWSGSPLRLLDDPKQLASLASQGAPEPVPPHDKSGIDLAAKDIVAVNYGYHGGRFVRRSMTPDRIVASSSRFEAPLESRP